MEMLVGRHCCESLNDKCVAYLLASAHALRVSRVERLLMLSATAAAER